MTGKKQKRILIARTDRLGDLILTTAIPREIKKKWPDSFVAILLRSYTKAVYENNPYVDEIITDDFTEESRSETFWQKVKELKNYKFTDALMLLPTERLNFMFFWAGIPNRVGVGHRLFQFLAFTKYVKRNFDPLRSEADYCMDLARKIGVKTENLKSEIFLTDTEKHSVIKLKEKWSAGGKKIIGIHSTSGNSAPNMPSAEYRNLANMISETGKFKVIITDPDPPDELLNIKNAEYIKLPLREFFINIAALDLLISASTGPMHVAGALGIKTLSLFCPLNNCHPDLWGPQGNEAHFILPDENYCSINCPGDPHICRFEGNGGIDSKVVFERFIKLFE